MTSLVPLPNPESAAFREETVKALLLLKSLSHDSPQILGAFQTKFEWERVDSITAILRIAMPTVAFANPARNKVNRIVFRWDGMSIQLLGVNNKPVPTAADLTKAVLALIDDAIVAITDALP